MARCPLSAKIIQKILHSADNRNKKPSVSTISTLTGYSNDVVRINLEDGNSLMVKRARYDWVKPFFESSRRASRLIRMNTPLIVPEHIPVSEGADSTSILVYKYIPLPTLKNLWSEISEEQKKEALKSLGTMLRQIHSIKVKKYGLLNKEGHQSITSFMKSDLLERLKPAVWAHWSDALPLVDRLAQKADVLPAKRPTLVHNDLHLDNILCNVENNKVTCVGLLDLEASGGGRYESDLASAIILHDPFFSREDEEITWLENFGVYLKQGYDKEPDPVLLHFFKIYHLLNMGFFFAHSNNSERARHIVETIEKMW